MVEKSIRELYLDDHKGLRAISKITGIPAATIRRRLIKAGYYRGAASGGREIVKETISVSVTGGEREPAFPDLTLWTARGNVSVVRDGGGWLVLLGGDFSSELTSPPLEEGWSGKGIEPACDLRLIAPAFGSLILGVRDAGTPFGSEANCILQSGIIPARWHVRHLCQSTPVVFFKANTYQRTVVHISSVSARKINGAGLKPVPLPAEKNRLKTGARFNLMDKWQAEGCRCRPVYPHGLEIDFKGLSSLYADLPFELWEREICFVMEMMSYSRIAQIEMVVGDDR